MNAGKILLCTFSTFVLNGCSTPTLRSAQTERPVQSAESREAVVVAAFAGKCESYISSKNSEAGGSGAIVASLVGMGVDTAVNAIGTALKNWKDNHDAAWFGSTVMPFSAAVPSGPTSSCITVTRGELTASSPLKFKEFPVFESYIDLTWQLVGTNHDKLALLAHPYEVDYHDTSAKVRGKGIKDVTILLAFSGQTLQTAAAAAALPATDKALGVLRLDLGRLTVGKSYDERLLKTVNTSASLNAADQLTLSAVVLETEGTNPVQDALLSAWDSNKSDLATALKEAINGK